MRSSQSSHVHMSLRELLGAPDSGERGSPVLRRDLTTGKFQIGDRRNNGTMRRVEEGEERRRATVLQDTMSIAVTDYGFFVQGELCGVWVKI